MRTKPHKPKRRAFTLIEVVIAIAVFAMAALMLGTAYLNVLNSYEAAARGQGAEADQRFARGLLLKEADLEKATEGGEFEGAEHSRVRWSAEITPLEMPDLFKVAFTCDIEEGSERRSSTENFVLLRPTWSEAADRDKLREEVRTRIEELNTQGTVGR